MIPINYGLLEKFAYGDFHLYYFEHINKNIYHWSDLQKSNYR